MDLDQQKDEILDEDILDIEDHEEEKNYHEGHNFDDASLSPEDDVQEPKEEIQHSQKEKAGSREQDRISKLKNKKYFLLEQNQKLIRENEKLKKEKEEAIETGLYEFGKNAVNELEDAKYRKKRALEEGDPELLIDSDIDIFKAQQKIDELDRTINYKEEEQYDREEDIDQIKKERIEDWIAEHPEINPNDSLYNPQKEAVVSSFVERLNQSLIEDGIASDIGSPSYLDYVNEFIADLDKQVSQQTPGHKMTQSKNQRVSSVRSHQTSSNNSQRYPQVILTRNERMAAKGLGMSESEYLKDKIQMMRKNGEL